MFCVIYSKYDALIQGPEDFRENVKFIIITNNYASIIHFKVLYLQYLLLVYILNCQFFHAMCSMFRMKMNRNDSNLDY